MKIFVLYIRNISFIFIIIYYCCSLMDDALYQSSHLHVFQILLRAVY